MITCLVAFAIIGLAWSWPALVRVVRYEMVRPRRPAPSLAATPSEVRLPEGEGLRGMMRRQGICEHRSCEPVALALTDEVVAQICVACHESLPPEWGCPDCSFEWIGAMGQPRLRALISDRCTFHSGAVGAT